MEARQRQRIKDYLLLAWPVAAEGVLIHILGAIDLVMAGALGAQAQAAIGIISQPRMMTLLFVRAFAVAITAVIARRYGQARFGEMNKVFTQSLSLIGGLYLILVGACLFFFPQILSIAGAQASYFESARLYGQMIFIGIFFTALATVINAGLVAVGRTKVIFVANVTGNLVNVILNYGFIYGRLGLPRLGIWGIGIGTMVGNIISLAISLWAVQEESCPLSLVGASWIPQGDNFLPIWKVLEGSLPEQFFERLGMFLYTIMVARLGLASIAVHHIAMNLCDVFYAMAMGLGTASAALTGQTLGRGQGEEAYAYGKVGERTGLVLAGLGFFLFLFLGPNLMSLFNKDREIIELGAQITIILAIVSFPQSLSLTHSGVLKGAGDTKYVARYSLIIIAIFRPFLTYILVYILEMGLMGDWISLLVDQSLRSLAATHRFYSRKWQKVDL